MNSRLRLALVSDIHGNLPALEAVAQDIRHCGVDAVINLGDSLSGPLLPRETAQFLMASNWIHLAGNHERQLLHPGLEGRGPSDQYAYSCLGGTELDWLASLPVTYTLEQTLFCCHGGPHDDKQYLLEDIAHGVLQLAKESVIAQRVQGVTQSLIACGHTHLARAVRTSRGQLLINPGSVGLPAYDDDQPVPHVVENGLPDARYAIVEHQNGQWQFALHGVPYAEAGEMARLAASRGRLDWARALESGYLSGGK